MFTSPFAESIVARAVKQEKLRISVHNLRDWTDDNYQSVDDHPYGGGAGIGIGTILLILLVVYLLGGVS